MEVNDKHLNYLGSTTDRKIHEFIEILSELRNTANQLDQNFLFKLSQTLQLKNCINTHEVKSISIIFSLAAIATKTNCQNEQWGINQTQITKIEDLHKLICPENNSWGLCIVQNQLVGWITKIWDKLAHFSSYLNYIDLAFLFYFIGESLLDFEQELKRLSKILLASVGKIKSIGADTLDLTFHLLDYFIKNIESKKVCSTLKLKLKIIKILFLSKIEKPNEHQIQVMKEHLIEFIQPYLQLLIDMVRKVEEVGIIKEQDLIWDRFFWTILTYYHRQPELQYLSKQLLLQMLNFRIDMQTVKFMIKQLQIKNEQNSALKWKQIFQLMHFSLKIYDKTKEVGVFVNSKSFIKVPINNNRNYFVQVCLKNSSRIYLQQKFLFMIQDKNRMEQLWVTAINETEGKLKLILLRVSNKNIFSKQQQYITWQQYKPNSFLIQFSAKQIKINVNNISTNLVTVQRFMANPYYIVIGDQDGTLGTSVRQIISIETFAELKKQVEACYKLDLNNKQYVHSGIRKKTQPCFVDIVKAIGDLDIFLLIISHAFKKLKKNPQVVDMVRTSLALMDNLVQIKGVRNMKLSSKQRQERSNAILCLCWQCSHQCQNALAVLQLLRVLSVRGIANHEDQLEILANFVFWKQFQWEYQRLIIMKIKQIFMEIRIFENYLRLVYKYCKRILMETALYYREEDTLNIPQQKNQILKIHYQFISLVKQQLQIHISTKKSSEFVYEFIQFILKLLSLTLSRKTNINNFDAFDIVFSIQLSLLARQTCEQLIEWKGKDQLLLKLIKCAIEVCTIYEAQQMYFQQKKLRIYQGEKGFMATDENIIKQNIYFLAYKLVSFKQSILTSLIQQEQKGAAQITCIAWQRQFFDKFIQRCGQNEYIFIDRVDLINKLKVRIEKLPLKYLSRQQNKIFLRIYLRSKDMFPQLDYSLQVHFWKIITIKQVLDVIKQQIIFNTKELSENTSTSKMNEGNPLQLKDFGIFRQKILSLLAICEELTSHEGLIILKTFQLFHPSSVTQQFKAVLFHFILKKFIQKTKQMASYSQSSLTINSEIQKQTKPSSSQIFSQQQECSIVLTRQDYIRCIQYYFNHLNVNDIMLIKGVEDIQEGNAHLQNYKINISCILSNLSSCDMDKIDKLKNFYFFLKQFLLQLSKYYLQTLEILPFFKPNNTPRKASKHQLQFPKFDLKEESKVMYLKFTEQRKLNLLKVEQIWQKVEERNKYFWSNFLGRQMQYTLHEATGPMNERYLLKKSAKKAKLQLPRMIRESIMKSASIMSQKFQFNQSESVSSILDDAHLYRKEPNSCFPPNKQTQSTKQGKANAFVVLLITSSKIYQGIATVTSKKLMFKETEEISQLLYQKIYASEGEKRTPEQCIRQNYKFQEQLSSKCFAVAKRYLFHDLALELHTKSRSYLFTFIKKGHRQAFTMNLQKTMKVIHRDGINEQVKRLFERWQNGEVSNYTYLMKLNDLAGRSFNDLSQYYIFPWTVTNFHDQLDLTFFKKKQNFRDMMIPVGKISKPKWENIKNNFQRTKKDEIGGIKPFLYGSFYSNPAIVSNFLIRINPFASQHYQLQSNQFDLADRLFYSIEDSYKSLTLCSSDFKQLIPEFYFFPEFLKNRNKYNLGSRQNKDIVNNVILARWAKDEYQFIFRMKKILQSRHITMGLHNWIDLIFGVYAKRQYALKADNLFLQNLYIDSYTACMHDKIKDANMYFKQFGQVPVPVMISNHKPTKFSDNFLDLITHQSMWQEQFIINKNNQSGKLLQICYSKKYIFFLFQKQIRMHLDQKNYQKDFISYNGQFQGGRLHFWQINQGKDRRQYLIIHRSKNLQLIGFEIKKNMFNRYSLDGGDILLFKHKVQLFTIYDNMIICSQGKNIYIYKKIQQEIQQDYSTKNFSIFHTIAKSKYLISAVAQFTQHKSKVIFLASTEKGMLVSIDEDNKVFLLQMKSNMVDIFNFFQIKGIYCQEKILQIILHNLGFIILRTNYDRLLVFSFLGDHIIDKIICFKKQSHNSLTEKIQTMTLWNPQLCQIIVGTNIGNLWKIDLFSIRKMQQVEQTLVWIEKIHLNKDGFRKEGLIKVAVNRIGRHSLILIYGQNTKLYVIKSQKWDEIKKISLERKKIHNF